MAQDLVSTLKNLIIKDLQTLATDEELICTEENFAKIIVEVPKNEHFGDFSTNVAMVLSKVNSGNPIQIGEKIVKSLQNHKAIFQKVEIMKPGFINLFLQNDFILKKFEDVFDLKEKFSEHDIWQNETVNLEFVSANPTGPMHIGHVRGAIIGDVLANLLQKIGAKVTREYYINDAGGQIVTLLKSVWLRIKELQGEKIEIPADCYPGEYIIEIARKLYNIESENFEDFCATQRAFILAEIMAMIKVDLALLRVHHDLFVSEQEIQERDLIQDAMAILHGKNLLYKGILEKPKGKADEDWEEREQLLFKSSEFGDEVDRSLQKSDDSWTYFAGDLSYHFDKCQRNFSKMFIILGCDHIGYEKRIKAVVNAFSDRKKSLSTIFYDIVNFLERGEKIKMSKRAGKFLTARDVVAKVGVDLTRFMMVSKSAEQVINFDFEEVVRQSKDNPIFYIQYAHTRCCSILRNFSAEWVEDAMAKKGEFLQFLRENEEKQLIKKILLWPDQVKKIALRAEPHQICTFLLELVTIFHSLWSLGRNDAKRRFILESDENLTKARVLLIKATQIVIQDALRILNIEAMKSM